MTKFNAKQFVFNVRVEHKPKPSKAKPMRPKRSLALPLSDEQLCWGLKEHPAWVGAMLITDKPVS